MELSTAVDFARSIRRSVLVTMRRDGRPQLSNVLQHVGDDGVIRVSVTADRAKYHNIAREPWAAVHITSDDFGAYAVIEGPAEVSATAGATDDTVVDELVALYRNLVGEHPDWDDYRRAMVTDRRAVVRITPARAYGQVPGG
jgi:PPOX class probable F420-dependent enzyme